MTREASSWQDLALSELDQSRRESLASLPWLNSLGFCTIYDHPPAQRVFMHVDDQGQIARAIFYRECRWGGMLKIVQCVGFPDCSDAEIVQLIGMRNAWLAIANRMEPPDSTGNSRGRLLVTHDVIAGLPASKEQYLQSLGKQKRQQLPRYWRRLEREFAGHVQFSAARGHDIQLDSIIQLVRFNQTRMERLGKQNTTIAESEKQQRRWPLTLAEGLLCTIESKGRLLGGTFNYIHNDEAFLIVIAHDPALERLNIGNLSVWKTVDHLIDSGIRRYHLFWGRKLYKTQFGGRDFPVLVQVISPHGWLVPLWTAHLWFWRQAPRAFRFARARIRGLFSRGTQTSDDQSDGDTGDGSETAEPR